MLKEPAIALVILNWNRGPDTVRCLESIIKSTYKNYTIIVIDNGSEDNSVEQILRWVASRNKSLSKDSEQEPLAINLIKGIEVDCCCQNNHELEKTKLTLIKNEKNYGFARGNNIGVAYAFHNSGIEYIMFLNNDTIIDTSCIERLVLCAEKNSTVAAFQPLILSMSNREIIDAAGIAPGSLHAGASQIGYGKKNTGQYDSTREIFGVCAGAALFRRKILQQIGLFDELFFAYYEDVDLAFRMRLSGQRTFLVPAAIVYHAHSSTLGNNSPLKMYLLERNRYFYVIKNLPPALVFKFLTSRPLYLLRSVSRLFRQKKFKLGLFFIAGHFSAIFHLPALLIKRKQIRSGQVVTDKQVAGWFEQ